jgi:serine/threonine-protein kinase HipA
MADGLAVWLHGLRVALIDQERGRLRLAYTDEALAQYAPGTPLLSLSLPAGARRYAHGLVRPFLDGLLPEGEARQAIANAFHLPRDDTFGLIRALGLDSAGAMVILPAAEPAPPPPTTLTAEPLHEDEIGALLDDLRRAPLGVSSRVRLSLAGVQEKLLLTRMPGGSWGRPVDGTPSTHILKPAIERFPGTVENEVFCMRLARNLGLDVPAVEMATVAGQRLIVVERYDRTVRPDGSVERIHQEDFCQATGIAPEQKYEEDGGPALRQIAEILQVAVSPDSLDQLLRAVTLNVAIGNGDAHGKNYSLLHEPSGALRLAPLYDLVCTLVYGDDRLAMYIDNLHRSDRVTADRLVNEAVRWGMSRRRGVEVVSDLLERIPASAEAARDETEGLTPAVLAAVESQLAKLRSALPRAA